MREKLWEERGPKAHSKNSDFGTPLILVLFSGLPIFVCESIRANRFVRIAPIHVANRWASCGDGGGGGGGGVPVLPEKDKLQEE